MGLWVRQEMGMKERGKEEKMKEKKGKLERPCGYEVWCGNVWERRNKIWKKNPLGKENKWLA